MLITAVSVIISAVLLPVIGFATMGWMLQVLELTFSEDILITQTNRYGLWNGETCSTYQPCKTFSTNSINGMIHYIHTLHC